jgi:hypothetical protein
LSELGDFLKQRVSVSTEIIQERNKKLTDLSTGANERFGRVMSASRP